jgi:hypothetical protein
VIKIKNPYSEIINALASPSYLSNKNNIEIGEVVSVDPFIIQIGKLQLDKDNLLIADYLMGHARQATLSSTPASGSAGQYSISSIGIPKMDLEFKSSLEKGDKLAVLSTLDGQTFVILCKVVTP